MKQLHILPTTHREYPNYSSKHLADLLAQIKPEVIFQELPSNWKTGDFSDCQEGKAISLYNSQNSAAIINVDLPYRNEIAKQMGLYEYEESIEEIIRKSQNLNMIKYREICRKIYEPEEKITIEYLRSKKCRNGLLKKFRLLNNYVRRNGDAKLKNQHRFSHYFHDSIREEAITYNVVTSMKNYNVGVLLIGAEHLNIDKKFQKYGNGIAIFY